MTDRLMASRSPPLRPGAPSFIMVAAVAEVPMSSDLRSSHSRSATMNDDHPSPCQPRPPAKAHLPADGSRTEIDPPLDLSKLGVRFSRAPEGHQRVTMGPDALEAIFGMGEPFQAAALLAHCVKVLSIAELGAGPAGEAEDERHFMLSVVKDLARRDVVERLLAVQMAATHVALVRAGHHLARATQLPQFEAHSTNYNKLSRTFTAQMEALRKHRTGGQQKVTVEHVHVHAGGQAIVGHVETGGRGGPDRGVGL